MENIRFKKRSEVLPEQLSGQSFYDFVRSNGGDETLIVGRIGRAGTKTHKFNASWIPFNGDKIIVGFHSICGSQSYKSGLGVTFDEKVTCKKCGAK